MENSISLLLCCLVIFASTVNGSWNDAIRRTFTEDEKDLATIMHIIAKPRKINSDSLGFSWSNCGKPTNPFIIKNLNLTPDPIKIPGTLGVSATINITAAVSQPLKAVMEIHKRLLNEWIKIPCIDNVGSCTYDDLCTLDPYKPGSTCPPVFGKFPCSCPFKTGLYTFNPAKFKIDIDLPSFLAKGEYKAEIKMSSSIGDVGCLNMQFNLD